MILVLEGVKKLKDGLNPGLCNKRINTLMQSANKEHDVFHIAQESLWIFMARNHVFHNMACIIVMRHFLLLKSSNHAFLWEWIVLQILRFKCQA